jgi:hypothetical protein
MMSDDLKRIESYTAAFEKTAVTIGFLLLLLALWARAPHFQINPASGAGFSGILGFNVGHAVVFGPVAVLIALGLYAGMLGQRELLRNSFYFDLLAGSYGDDKLSTGAQLVLDKFHRPHAPWSIAELADRATRAVWFFLLPLGASAIFIRRYIDFIPGPDSVPFTESKSWSLFTRVNLHLFSGRLWEVRAALADHYLDENPLVSGQMPYIYSPLQSWIYVVVFIISCILAVRAWQLYFQATPFPSPALALPAQSPPPAID